MGQYYNPSILKKNWKQAKNPVLASLKCYDYNNGAKLMEHSYVGNGFVNAVEDLLANDYKGYPFVWIGDYADNVTTNTGEHNIYNDANSFIYKDRNCSENTKKYKELRASIPDEIHHYKYLINYTKKEYCIIPEKKEGVWQVHPLPLLTCNGNGRGGGDYHLDDERVGIWAFNRIGITNDKREIVGFKEINGFFELDW
jgi:hypothetical protein